MSRLGQSWHFSTRDVVSTSPAIVDGTVYVGDWTGYVYALDLETGRVRWTYRTQFRPTTAYSGQIISSPAVADVDGEPTVFIGANQILYALRASDGALRWRQALGSGILDPTNITSSPVVAKDFVIVGTDVYGDPRGWRAGLFALEAATGRVRWRFDPEEGRAPKGCGGVWSSPSLDLERRLVYVGTGSCRERKGFGRYSEAIVAVDLDTGQPRWAYQPHRFNRDNLDFGGAPNAIELGARKLIGLGNKDGVYYAVTPTGELAWIRRVLRRYPGRTAATGFIGPSGYANGIIFGGTAGHYGPDFHALHARTGRILWQRGNLGYVYGPPAETAGVVFVGDYEGMFRAVELATGRTLWAIDTGAPILGGAAIVGDQVVTVTGHRSAETGKWSKVKGVTAYELQ